MNYFSEQEQSCNCCGENKFNPDTLKRFNALREKLGFPLQMTSMYRCPTYNKKIGATQTHATGQAGDILISHEKAYKLLAVAWSYGFSGIGINQKGNKRFIHLDDLEEAEGRPRPHIWSY